MFCEGEDHASLPWFYSTLLYFVIKLCVCIGGVGAGGGGVGGVGGVTGGDTHFSCAHLQGMFRMQKIKQVSGTVWTLRSKISSAKKVRDDKNSDFLVFTDIQVT